MEVWRRFKKNDRSEKEKEKFEELLINKNISKEDLVLILRNVSANYMIKGGKIMAEWKSLYKKKPYDKIKEGAKGMKKIYDVLIGVGFCQEQAMEIIKVLINGGK